MRLVAIVFVLIAASVAALLGPEPARLPVLSGAGVLGLVAIVRGVFHPASGLVVPTVARGPRGKQVALTFHASECAEPLLRSVVAILAENGARATFFFPASREALFRATSAHARGLLLGGKASLSSDLAVVEKLTGKKPLVRTLGAKLPGLPRVVGWVRRAKGSTPSMVATLVAAKGGEIVAIDLVEPAVAALREALPLLKARGLELVTVDAFAS